VLKHLLRTWTLCRIQRKKAVEQICTGVSKSRELRANDAALRRRRLRGQAERPSVAKPFETWPGVFGWYAAELEYLSFRQLDGLYFVPVLSSLYRPEA
jgi:hypothetical protein